MAEEKRRGIVILVCGYGCHLTEPIKKMLEDVAHVANTTKDVLALVLSGGKTNKATAPGLAEALVMYQYLSRFLSRLGMEIHLDDMSLTTNQNIEFVRSLFFQENSEIQITYLLIFGDKSHAIKIKMITRLICGIWPTNFSYNIISGFKEQAKQLFIGTPFSILASKIKFLRSLELKRKERIIDVS